MARKLGVKDKGTRSTRRSSYETYKSWVKKYGGTEIMTKSQFNDTYQLRKKELKSEGKSTTNLARSLAQESSFTYDYNTGRAIKAAYEEKFEKKISLRSARNIMEYEETLDGKIKKVVDTEFGAEFWNHVADKYSEEKKKLEQKGEEDPGKKARAIIAETIFGSL